MEMSGQFHAPVAAHSGKNFPVPAVRAQENARFFGEKPSASTGNRISLRRLSSPHFNHYTGFATPITRVAE